jgi:hypothetical protein
VTDPAPAPPPAPPEDIVEKDRIARAADGVKWLAGGLTVATVALALVGLTGPNVTRLVQVYPVWFGIAAAALAASSGLGVACYFVDDRKRIKVLAGVALVLFFGGLMTMVVVHSMASGNQQRPTLTMGLTKEGGGYRATVKVTAAHLQPDQYVFLLVQGQTSQRQLEKDVAAFTPTSPGHADDNQFYKQRIYKGRIGPSPTGEVDVEFEVDVAAQLYEQVVAQAVITRVKGDQQNGNPREVEVESGKEDLETHELVFTCTGQTPDVSCATVLMPEPPTPTPSANP